MSLTKRIIWAMVLGLALGVMINIASSQGWLAATFNNWIDVFIVDGLFDVVGRIFVASLKLLVVPLVFVSLVCGTASLGDNTRMGPMAGKTLVLYMFTTAVAISLALIAGTVVQPGAGIDLQQEVAFEPSAVPSLKDVVINIFPDNPVQAMAAGNMLQVIVFAILMGIAISRSGERGRQVAGFFNDFNDVIMKMVTMLMHLAPYGVFCLLAKLFSGLGIDAIWKLGKYFFCVVGVLLLHGLGVYSLMLKLLAGLNPATFLNKLRPVMMFAFSTASSNATIPVTLRTAEKRLGVDNSVASFTVPLGATINMDGTAIMQGVATAFIAQAYGIDIGLSGYMMVIMTATLASIGTAGVPGVGLITLTMVLTQVGLPAEGIAFIIGVDRLLDMVRTAVNVTGDSMVSLVVAKTEGELNEDMFATSTEQLVAREEEENGARALQATQPG
ncbi:dicarboxylate/amino acid:cation symporter [Exilibacterium tricleocarpae]|uniref:Dicarboxylate/amino acid:cation symporter n=1 Tax=Exilibacterium tricleocarpae TaxID=2591008 RepID=A0A545TZC7_9GAMM|nr:dicarboxylate/amino acid:cation symporter [Exilibacterium tricleocarpae]TQV82566.1 dicarboxylate/amino acid:cation symporter [Exilibacterium tricleocarpae]